MTPATDQVARLGGALGWGIVARIARFALGLVGSVLVVRTLGAYDYGILAVVRTALAFAAILVGGGLTQGILRYLPGWRVQGDVVRIRQAISLSLVLQLGLWFLVVGLLFGFRDAVTALSSSEVSGLLLLGAALLLPEAAANTATQIANAQYDSRRITFAVAISVSLYVALLAVFLHRGLGVAGVLVAGAISNLLLAKMLWSYVPGYLREAEPGEEALPETRRAEVRAAVRYSLPFLAIGVLNLITWRQSEVLFLGRWHGAEAAGFFDLAYRLPQMILEFVPGAIWPLVLAGFAEVYTRDPYALQRATSAYYKLLFLLVAPVSVGGVLVGDLAVSLLYGPEFAVAGRLTQIFFIVFSISFLATPLSMVLYVVERPGIGLGIVFVNAVINVVLDILLIPRFGVWGAVTPVAVVIVLSPGVYAYVLNKLDIHVRPPWRFLARLYGASALMLLLWPVRRWADDPVVLTLFVIAGIGLFVAGLRWFGVFGVEERSLVARVSPRLWSRLEPWVGSAGGNGSGR